MKIANVAVRGMKNYRTKVRNWLEDRRPDIVTLQKIGSSEPFPEESFRKLDYESWFLDHDSYYRGVSILAHRDFLNRRDLPPNVRDCHLPGAEENGSRFLTVDFGGLWISSVYVPPPKPRISRTLHWLNRLRDYIDEQGYARQASVLCGDFNVRADDTSKGKLRHALEKLKNLGFIDLYREAHPDRKEKPGYTRGYGQKDPSRLHLALASKQLARCRQDVYLDVVDTRPREDAPPLVVDFDSECVTAGVCASLSVRRLSEP